MLTLVVVLCIIAVAFGQFNSTGSSLLAAYNGAQSEISLWLSTAAYCGKDSYKTRTFKGPTTGFVVTNVIFDSKTDMQGYVGYLPSDKSIYVVFRGSSSIRNWIQNLDTFKTSYTSYPECNCQVHKGFYLTEQAVIGSVISAVKALRTKYPSYGVKLTGHSLGAAIAQLTSMDLLKAGIPITSLYDFGQPRIGDKAYATFANSKLQIWRVTHNADIVPHIPFTTKMEFYQNCREEFENAAGVMKTCDTSCEDPTCTDQYAFSQTNADDHCNYMGIKNCDCKTVS